MTAPDLRAAARAVIEAYPEYAGDNVMHELRAALADAEREEALDAAVLEAAEVWISRDGKRSYHSPCSCDDCQYDRGTRDALDRLADAVVARRDARGEASPQP